MAFWGQELNVTALEVHRGDEGLGDNQQSGSRSGETDWGSSLSDLIPQICTQKRPAGRWEMESSHAVLFLLRAVSPKSG